MLRIRSPLRALVSPLPPVSPSPCCGWSTVFPVPLHAQPRSASLYPVSSVHSSSLRPLRPFLWSMHCQGSTDHISPMAHFTDSLGSTSFSALLPVSTFCGELSTPHLERTVFAFATSSLA